MTPTVDWFIARWRRHEQFRFLVIGGWNTLFAVVAFFVLYAWFHDHLQYLLIGVFAHALAVVNAFVTQRFLVFRTKGRWVGEFLRFNVTQLAMLAFSLVGLWSLVSLAGLDPRVAQLVVTLIVVAVSYVAHRRFTFAAR